MSVAGGTVAVMNAGLTDRGDDERRIAASFNDYFANFGIGIRAEDVAAVAAGGCRTIRDSRTGWAITFRVDRGPADDVSLEFYATNRRTNDRHVLIAADGSLEHLDAIREMLIPSSDTAAKEFEADNAAVAAQLRQRGLYPHG